MAQSSRTFRIFVSSTFSDLKEERNALQEKVFPRLRDLAVSHGCRFQAIDLRWGVSEEAALDQQTMKICLNEIERCQKTSPKPNFIVLLGDRYGWRPIPSEIPADEFEKIISKVAKDEKPLLEKWYRRDDNAVPPVYCLQARSGEYVDYSSWEEVETRLRQTFLKVIEKLSLSPDETLKYTASATEQEIVAGALKVPDAKDHVFCFFREISGLPNDENSKDFHDSDAKSSHMQSELKARLKKQLASNVHEYTAQWQGNNPSLDHLEQLCEDVYSELSKVILVEAGKLEKVDSLDAEIAGHEIFGKDRARVFIGRADILNAIEKYISGNDPHPLAIWGASGSGKSALMAKAVEQAQKNGQDVLYRFIGATPESSNGRALLESLCRQISRRYGADESTIPSEYKDLVQEFPKRLALATAEKPLIIFLDALDQLSDTDSARNLIWLPANLPPNVRLIISTLPGECLQALESKLPAGNRLEVQLMSVEDGKNILAEWLSGLNRQLQKKQEEHLLGRFQQCGLPLYLKLAFEEARLWNSYSELPELSKDIPGILRDLFTRLSRESNHGEMLISRSLGYLAAAKNGLSEDELLDVLSLDKEMLADFQRRSPKSPKSDRLPVVIWSRLYFDLEPYLTERSADATSLLSFYHRQMSEACQTAYRDKARHAGLAAYFNTQPLYLEKDEQAPNMRKLSEMVYQQAWAGLSMQVEKTLLDYKYMEAKLAGQGVQELIDDYVLVPQAGVSKEKEKSLSLLEGALSLSAHVLRNDPLQLPSQLTGRLLRIEDSSLSGLLEQVYRNVKRPWLRPLKPCLYAPGGALLRTLAGHTRQVIGIALTPDGRCAVSASQDKTLKVWDLASGTCLRTLEGHTTSVSAVVLTPDGRCAVSASSETLKVWDLASGACLRTLKGHRMAVSDVALTSDGRCAISASQDKTLKVWNLASGTCIRTLEGHTNSVNALALTPDGRCAISASEDKTLKVWNIESGTCLRTLEGHINQVNTVALTPDGRCAVSCSSYDYILKVWNIESGTCLRTLEGHTDHVVGMALTPDGHCAISASDDKTLKVWNIESGTCLRTLEGHTDHVNTVVLTPDGRFAISASEDKTLKVWNIESGACLRTLEGAARATHVVLTSDGRCAVSGSSYNNFLKVWNLENSAGSRTLEGHTTSVSAVVLTPDGRCAVSASLDKTLKVWDIESGACLRTLKGHRMAVSDVALTPDGRGAVSASYDKTLKVWDLASGTCLRTLTGHTGFVAAVALTPNGRCAVSASHDKTLKVWDLESGNCIRTLEGHTQSVNCVLLTPDGRYVVSTFGGRVVSTSTSEDKTLKVWDLESGDCIRTLEGHTDQVVGMALASDGCRVVSASWDKTLKVWDLASGNCIRTLEGHTDRVNAVELTSDGRCAISASNDHTLKLWDLESGDCLCTVMGHIDPVFRVTLLPNSRCVVSATGDRALKVWDLANGTCLASIYGEDGMTYVAYTPDELTLVVGSVDAVYFLHLENVVTPRSPSQSNWEPVVEAWQKREKKDRSITLLTNEERIRHEAGDKEKQQQVLGQQAAILYGKKDFDSAMALYIEQAQICRELGNKDGLKNALTQQASILFGKKDYDGAMKAAREQELISRETGDNIFLQYSLGCQADVLNALGRKDEALAFYKEREQICRELGDKNMLQTALGQQAAILYMKKDFDNAMAFYIEQAQICRELGNKETLKAALGYQAAILYGKKDYDNALALYKEQEQICRVLNNKASLQNSLGQQAVILYLKKDFDSAMIFYIEQAQICRELGNKETLKAALGFQVAILYGKKDFDSAMKLCVEQAQICRELGNKETLQDALGYQAAILYGKKDYDSALALYKEQEQICRELGNKDKLKTSLGNQALVLKARGDTDGAMALQKAKDLL